MKKPPTRHGSRLRAKGRAKKKKSETKGLHDFSAEKLIQLLFNILSEDDYDKKLLERLKVNGLIPKSIKKNEWDDYRKKAATLNDKIYSYTKIIVESLEPFKRLKNKIKNLAEHKDKEEKYKRVYFSLSMDMAGVEKHLLKVKNTGKNMNSSPISFFLKGINTYLKLKDKETEFFQTTLPGMISNYKLLKKFKKNLEIALDELPDLKIQVNKILTKDAAIQNAQPPRFTSI